ncbi:MAG TPA: biotin--[acetyl-CoA-carboxylase] ligase, partial [Microthrixaceae bacterium]|nr:biotin--[acetyl-CoA-carboxylase] ligase [Microthrixaceae bacterium]
LMTMCLSVAVTDASIELGIPSVSIKWPNDLVAEAADVPLGYRKLGGILAETAMSPVLGDCVILGLGLNVNWTGVPDELAATATSLNSLSGQPVDREDLVIAILRRLDEVWLPAVEGSETAVQQLFDVYRQRCSTLRRKVSIELPTGTLTGTATDIAPDGALLVSSPNGIRTVTVGDVVHLRPQQ